MKTTILAALAAAGLMAADAALAHGEKPHAARAADAPLSTERHPWGMQGDPRRAVRTVQVSMSDRMRFSPDRFEIRRGETVSFDVRNAGKVLHEFVIGTEAELVRHAELMKKHPDMEHDEPYMAHVGPGQRQRITWRFTEAGTFYAGCLLPGHWEAGMKATIVVKE
jgi:uncharacterized cupredoxin-like copper-binding protein